MQKPSINVVSSTTRQEVDRILGLVAGPVLQIGSKATIVDAADHSWRSRFPAASFTGMDIAAGENVDVVADICDDIAALDEALGGRRFGFIVCQHVLEHVRRPWVAAANIEALLAPGGYCYIAVPWVQSFHGYPHDYWRFSFLALVELFGGLDFIDMHYSGTGTGYDAAYKILVDGRVDLAHTPFEIEQHLFQMVIDKEQHRAHPDFRTGKRLPASRVYMPALFVNALGRKR